MKTLLLKKLQEKEQQMIDVRRYLHMHPELSFQETKTAAYIADFYKARGIDVRTQVGGNGVVARVKGAKPGKTIALRADFDALPIQDAKDVPYKSTVPGVMHACGHDGHTATLLAVAETFHELRDQLTGEYVFLHQHAEELSPGGAKSMIEDGCLEGVDAVFGTHLWTPTPAGTIAYCYGPMMAAADMFTFHIQGSGGHGATPHETKDSVVIGASLVTLLQQLVARRIDPIDNAVLSIGSFVAENASNVIADTAVLKGTVRTFDPLVRDKMEEEIRRIVQGVEIMNDCTITIDYERGYPPVVNHEKETDCVIAAATEIIGADFVHATKPDMGGEDFAYYLQEVPGAFFYTGAMTKDPYPHHHPHFDIDEAGLLLAAKTLATVAINYQDC